MRILIADDEAEMTDVLEALLSREHYAVDIVHDGQDALDYGLTGNYDCLVLDIMMPKLDGLQVLRALRDRGISTPVLLLTAKSQVADRIAGLDSGADDYLPKPFHPGEFTARVRALTCSPLGTSPWTAPPSSCAAVPPPSVWAARNSRCLSF